jgi:hypothetical protein
VSLKSIEMLRMLAFFEDIIIEANNSIKFKSVFYFKMLRIVECYSTLGNNKSYSS